MMPDLVQQKSSGMWIRKGTWDEAVWGEQRFYEGLVIPGWPFLDLGGNIGATVIWAAKEGAGEITSVEPDPTNFAIMQKNLAEGIYHRHIRIQAAAVPSYFSDPTVSLYLNHGKDPSSHTVLPVEGRPVLEVAALKLPDLIARSKAASIKMDIEGAEYGLLNDLLVAPAHVFRISVELHLRRKGQREAAAIFVEQMGKQFRTLKEARLTPTAWTAQGLWEKK